MLKKKPFEYITVSELCETAGVNRSTFYLHYENIGDLLDETAQYLIDGFLSYFGSNKDSVSLNLSNCEIFATALSNGKSFGFENIFNPILERFQYPEEDRKYVMMYYLNGITAVITEWITDNCKKSISDTSRIIQECIFGLNNTETKLFS